MDSVEIAGERALIDLAERLRSAFSHLAGDGRSEGLSLRAKVGGKAHQAAQAL
jgi:hypothetical protein